MSIPVALDDLRPQVEAYGAEAYLLTVSDDGRPHATSVAVAWDGDRLGAPAGTRTARNAGQRPAVTLLFRPFEAGGYHLIVDGDAQVVGDRVLVCPTWAVLHRPAVAGAEPSPSGCTSDCVPLTRRPS